MTTLIISHYLMPISHCATWLVHQGGEVTVPGKGTMFYLSQRPYLVAGSLRDQLLYPWPPRGVMPQSHHSHRPSSSSRKSAGSRDFSHMAPAMLDDVELEARLEAALEAVELDYLLGRCACCPCCACILDVSHVPHVAPPCALLAF